MFKRFSACFLALVLLLGLLPGVRAESAVIASGTAGADITWTLLENGLLELSGTGAMEDYRSYDKAPWYSNRSGILEIHVGSGITTLGNNAFGGCDRAASVSLPASLKRIGKNAFTVCKALRSVTVPDGVTELGDYAFNACEKLTQITLPHSLRTVGNGAFYQCKALSAVTIPEGVTSLGNKVFSECKALEMVSLPSTLEQIGEQVFYFCPKLTVITVAEGNESFCVDGQYALYDRGMTTLLAVPGGFRGTFVIPDTVTTVVPAAGSRCSGMTGVHIPDSVTSIGGSAFAYNSLTHVTVPDSITVIPGGCFYYNEELASVSIPETVTEIGGYAFGYCEALTSVSIPETVTEIGGSAFGYCEALTEITLPENLTALGEAAFWGCRQLRSIVIPEGIRALESCIFYNCTNLQTVQLPSRLESIDYWCFQYCTSLRDLVLPDTLKTIGANAFEDTTSLTSIVFPASIRELAAFSFRNSGLTEMTFLGDAPALDLGLGLEEYAFGGVTATAYYPMYNPTWTEEVRQDYSGELTWVAVDNHTHSWQTSCTEPRKCALCGITEGEAPGHDWKGLNCTRCGEARENPFVDTDPEGFYFDAVLWAVEGGITVGTDENHFNPDGSCSRAHVVTFLWRAAGKPEPETSANPFVDVKPGSFCEKAVRWAVEQGITVGTDDDHFSPEEPCNRAQVVTFLWRAAGQPEADGEIPFADVPADAWYAEPVRWAVEKGITQGVSSTEFGTEGTCTRAQAVTFLHRTFG